MRWLISYVFERAETRFTLVTMRSLKPGVAMKIEPITRDPQYAQRITELTNLEKRRAETHKRRARALALKRGVPAGRSSVERALDLVKGGIVPSLDPDREIQACDEEEFILRKAIVELSQQIDDLRGDLSLTVCRRIQSEHTAHLRAAVKAIEDLNAAFRAAAEIRAKVRDAGFTSLGAVLPDGMPPAVLALGDGRDGRQVNLWKSYVELHSGIKF